jgi:hypothetical protein
MAIYTDPQNKLKVGIYCDLCGTVSKDKFEYYSGKIDFVQVDRAASQTGIVGVDRRFLDIDLCILCMEKLKKQMLEVINRREKSGTWTSNAEKKP